MTNTTSKQNSSAIHIVATATSGGDARSADVPRTPAMITGTVMGYNRIGSITSRVRARTSMAANSVPTEANPTVPVSNKPVISTGRENSAARNSSATSGRSSASAMVRSNTMPSSLPT